MVPVAATRRLTAPSRWRVHVDTDFAGDPDDACALAYLLARDDVEIVGITTNLDRDTRRAALVEWFLRLAGAPPIPVAAGAPSSSTDGARFDCTWDDPRHWPMRVEPLARRAATAVELLGRSIAGGATIIAIGALTNLAAARTVAARRAARRGRRRGDGRLDGSAASGAPAVGTGGGLQRAVRHRRRPDGRAARGRLTLVTLPAAITAHLCRGDLDALRAAGAVGGLLAAAVGRPRGGRRHGAAGRCPRRSP